MDWTRLDSVKRNPEWQPNSWRSKSSASTPSTGGCLGKGQCCCVDPGAIVEGKSQHQSADFQKARDANPKQHRLACSHQLTHKTKINSKNYQRLGYIYYDATTSSWVTFYYELTGAWHRFWNNSFTFK